MRSISTIFSIMATCFAAQGQGYYPFPPLVLSAADISSGSEVYQVAQEIQYNSTEPFRIHNTANVEMISGTRVRINGNFKASDFASGGRFHAKIAPPPFAVAIASPDLTNGTLGKFEKLEIAIRPNDQILSRIQTFIDYSNSHTDSEAFYMSITPATYQNDGWLANGGINPFMEWEIKVSAEFVALDEEDNSIYSKNVDGFYYYECPREVAGSGQVEGWSPEPSDMPFRVRTVLDRVGKWKCRFKIEVPDMTTQVSDWYFLDVVDEGLHGFVEVAENTRFLSLDGESFFILGHNQMTPGCTEADPYQCSGNPGRNHNGVVEYPEAFTHFENYMNERVDEGMKYFRFIMNPSGIDIEFERLGNYLGQMYPSQGDPNATNIILPATRYKYQILAAEFDRILEWADERDVFIDLVLHLGNSFKEYAPYYDSYYDWLPHNLGSYKDNAGIRHPVLNHNTGYCYSTIPGVEHPLDALTDENAWKYYKQRLRYQISRWGYSTQIAQMDIMSEVEGFGAESIIEFQGQFADDGVLVYHPYYGEKRNITSTNGTDNGNDWSYDVVSVDPMGNQIAQWQNKVAEYIKNGLGHKDHLIGISYADNSLIPRVSDTQFSNPKFENDFGDWSFRSDHIDIVGMNYYQHVNTKPNRFFDLVEQVLLIQLNIVITTTKFKPVVIGETNAGGNKGVWNCDQDIEWRRAAYAFPFTGVAGGMNWDNQGYDRPYLMNHLRYMNHFMDQIDVANASWVYERSQGTGDDHRAEYIYMRSQDRSKAFGLLSNRTANFYTNGLDYAIDPFGHENVVELSNCKQFVPPNEWTSQSNQWDQLHSIGSLQNGNLVINGLLENTEYELTYYNPNDYQLYPATPVHAGPFFVESNAIGVTALPLQLPSGAPILTGADPFMLVEVKVKDSQFIGRYGSDDLSDQDRAIGKDDLYVESTGNTDSRSSLTVYPNPIRHDMTLIADADIGIMAIELRDFDGRIVHFWPSISVAFGQTKLSMPDVACGPYLLVCRDTQGSVHRFKLIKS